VGIKLKAQSLITKCQKGPKRKGKGGGARSAYDERITVPRHIDPDSVRASDHLQRGDKGFRP